MYQAQGQTSGFTSIGPIPAGKIFVLETVSYSFSNNVGAGLAFIDIQVQGNNSISGGQGYFDYYLTIPTPAVTGLYAGSQPMRVYVPPQTNIVVLFDLTANIPAAQVSLTLSGYYVDAQ